MANSDTSFWEGKNVAFLAVHSISSTPMEKMPKPSDVRIRRYGLFGWSVNTTASIPGAARKETNYPIA